MRAIQVCYRFRYPRHLHAAMDITPICMSPDMISLTNFNISSLRHQVFVQLMLAALLALVLAWFRDGGLTSFWSSLFGSLLATSVSIWFLVRTLSDTSAQDSKLVLIGLYRAEIYKFMLVAVLLGLCFKLGTALDRFALLLAFCVSWISNMIASAFFADNSFEGSKPLE